MLNAILCTRPQADRLETLDQRLAPVPPFRGLRPHAGSGLRCVDRDGIEPYVIHQFVRKPWIEPMYHGIYSELLRRAWLEPHHVANTRSWADLQPLRKRNRRESGVT